MGAQYGIHSLYNDATRGHSKNRPYFSHFCLFLAAMMTVAFFWDIHLATSKPIPDELPK